MRSLNVFVSCLVVGSVGLAAVAQDAPVRGNDGQPGQRGGQPGQRGGQPGQRGQPGGPGGPGGGMRGGQQLSPEQAKAAWELQASTVAKRVGAKDDQVKSVVKAYIEARESHNAASEKMRRDMMEKAREAGGADPAAGGGGGARGAMGEMQKAMEALNTAERAKLQKALAGILSVDQAAKANASLGTFNRQWDTMVDTIAGFKLESAKQTKALSAIEDFVVASTKARTLEDREASRDATQDARDTLQDTLDATLTEEQLAKFRGSMGGGRGMGGPGGGGGQGGRPNRGGGGGGF